MCQVISNLLRNSINFTTGNQAKIEIILEKVKEDNKKNKWIAVGDFYCNDETEDII